MLHQLIWLRKISSENYESKLATGFHRASKQVWKLWPTKNLRRKLPQSLLSLKMLLSIGLCHFWVLATLISHSFLTQSYQIYSCNNLQVSGCTEKFLKQNILSLMEWPCFGQYTARLSGWCGKIPCLPPYIIRLWSSSVWLLQGMGYESSTCSRFARCMTKKNAADFVLTLDSPLPPHSLSLKVSQNKVQLISFITAKLWEPIKQLLSRNQSILVSGLDNEPLKMSTSDLGPAKNATLRNCNMEVDMIMIQHVVDCTTRKPDAVIRAQCTDKDGFLLLHNIQHSLGISAVMMVHQSQNETHWHWPMCRWAKRHYNFAVTAWDIRLRHSQQN